MLFQPNQFLKDIDYILMAYRLAGYWFNMSIRGDSCTVYAFYEGQPDIAITVMSSASSHSFYIRGGYRAKFAAYEGHGSCYKELQEKFVITMAKLGVQEVCNGR